MFRLLPGVDPDGTSWMREVKVPPAQVVRRFGVPGAGDNYKVSGGYAFADANGEIFIVHDWKATNLWDPRLPSPDEFWAGEEPEVLTIATYEVDPGEFERWFLNELGLAPA